MGPERQREGRPGSRESSGYRGIRWRSEELSPIILQLCDGLVDIVECAMFTLFPGEMEFLWMPALHEFLDSADIYVPIMQIALGSRHVFD